jgi:hypothetical protein
MIYIILFLNHSFYIFQRTGKLKIALTYLEEALKIELELDNPQSLSDTHLNMCAVLSQLEKHEEALEHVLMSIMLLQDEFLQGESKKKKAEQRKQTRRYFEEADTQKGSFEDRIAVLAIAYHNLGVEMEYLKRVGDIKRIRLI